MPSPATTWLHVSGYRFLLRRIECALLFGDVCAATGALRARTTSLALGCVLAIVAAMGCAFVALLRPQSALGQAPIVMGRESGALYVRVDDVWHPVLNLASARLIAATNANPQPVSESELGHTKRGPLLGIPGAPQLLDQPLAGAESAWAICDSDNGGSTTVVVGPAEDSSAQVLTAEQMILVATESGSPTYLLYGGRRAVVDLADPAVVWALRLQAGSRTWSRNRCSTPSRRHRASRLPGFVAAGGPRSGCPGFWSAVWCASLARAVMSITWCWRTACSASARSPRICCGSAIRRAASTSRRWPPM